MTPDPAEHIGLARYHLKWFTGHGLPSGDLIGAGVIGLIRSCRRFSESYKCKFATYSSVCIRNEMREALRKERCYRRHFTVEADADIDVEAIAAAEIDEHKAEPQSDVQLLARAVAAIDEIPPRQAEVIRSHFGLDGRDPETLRSIAMRLGTSPQRVHQLKDQAIENLRVRVEAKYAIPKPAARKQEPPKKSTPSSAMCGRPAVRRFTLRDYRQPERKPMPLNRTNTAPPRELPTAEPHHAVCNGHYHIGTQHSDKYDKDDDQIILTFALLDQRRSDGSYFYLATSPMTISYGDKANLGKLVKGWLGRVPAVGEDFDTASLLGKQCFLTVVHNDSGGTTYANIGGVMALPRSVPQAVYGEDPADYSPLDPHKPIPEWVPRWVADKIQQSAEWVSVHGEPKRSGNGNGQAGAAPNGHAAVAQAGVRDGNTVDTRPSYTSTSKPPMAIAGYVGGLGIGWPYNDKELDAALAKARVGGEDEKTVAEYEAALRPQSIPF